jgi:hypothetical protein
MMSIPNEALEQNDYIPAWFTQNLKHLVMGQEQAPWTGYYTMYQGAKLAVSNIYGIWFKIQCCDNFWAAICPAWMNLNLQSEAMEGINIQELLDLGEPLPTSHMPSRAPSHVPSQISIHSKPEKDEPMRILAGCLTEMECQPPWRPQGTGDNPFGINDLTSEASHPSDNNVCLEGIPPNKFKGDRAKTIPFLTQFKRFMLMNQCAVITQDPYMKSAFFLSLMKGPKVKGWMQCTYNWLNQVKANPTQLPFKMNAWQALKANFKQSFVNYAEHECAQDELRKLKMKDSNVDEYIAAFQLLGHHVGMNLNDPSMLRLFAHRLLKSLANLCIDINLLENFEQWANVVQCHHRNYLKKLAVHHNYMSPCPQMNSNCSQFFWHCSNQTGNVQLARPCLPPCDLNAMDMSAAACKAITEADKEKHHKEGCCFECLKQGHMAWDCPDWPHQPVHAWATDTTNMTEIGNQEENTPYGPKELASLLRKLSEDDRDSFIKAMQEGEDMGFQDAWMTWLSFGHVLLEVCMYLKENQLKWISYYTPNKNEPSRKPFLTLEQWNASSTLKSSNNSNWEK